MESRRTSHSRPKTLKLHPFDKTQDKPTEVVVDRRLTFNRQSPIDIPTLECKLDGSLVEKPFRIIYPRRLCSGCVLTNTGHSWKLCIGQPDRYSVMGGPLDSRYCLDQVHAHWGAEDHCGSEHLVDGKSFAGELHFVHWNQDKYQTAGDALDHEDGLCVIGVFLKIGHSHSELEKLAHLMDSVRYAGSKFEMSDSELDLQHLLPFDTSRYWTYHGSLTTAPYSECVTWIVLQQPIEVSQEQVSRMRSLLCYKEDSAFFEDEGAIISNYRPIQPRDLCLVRSSSVPELPSRQQSPINIYTHNVFFAKHLIESRLAIRYPATTGAHLENTGHTWKVSVGDANFEIEGGPLKCVYRLDHMHAHWGATDRSGSEHLVNGKNYVGELHFVHWNEQYGNLTAALTKPDGLAVIGVFLEIGNENSELRKLMQHVDEICHPGRRKEMEEVNLNGLLPKGSHRYWSYQGSLTTPPYLECVTWIVMKEPIKVSQVQMTEMRSLRNHAETDGGANKNPAGRILYNYRPVQRIQACKIWCSGD